MKKMVLRFTCIIFIISFVALMNACNDQPQNTTSLSPSLTNSVNKDYIDVMSVRGGLKSIDISGTTTLSDGTILQSQLYFGSAAGQAVTWWPRDLKIIVKNKMWMLSVPMGKNGVPDILPRNNYGFKIWDKDNPSIYGTQYIDMIGPPTSPPLSPSQSVSAKPSSVSYVPAPSYLHYLTDEEKAKVIAIALGKNPNYKIDFGWVAISDTGGYSF